MLGATTVWFMMKTNFPARKIMETHTAVDKLQVIHRDVLKIGPGTKCSPAALFVAV
jgi:hypothetical protein